MTWRPLSVRARLTAGFAAALAAIVLVFAAGVYGFVRRSLLGQLDRELAQQAAALERTIQREPDEIDELDEAEEHRVADAFRVEREGKVVYRSRRWRRAQLGAALEPAPRRSSWSWRDSDGRRWRLAQKTFRAAGAPLALAVAGDERAVRQSLDTLLGVLAIAFPLALALAIVGGYVMAGRALRPVGAMAAKARDITAERLSERLPVENPHDEFGQLATVFNETLARLENSFDELRRFTSDASHELRTPLTAIRSVGEVGLDTIREPAAREVVGSMLEEVDRLARLTDSLLVLSRADAGRASLRREVVDLAGLAREAAECLRVLAEEKDQILSIETDARLDVRGDGATLRMAVMNLVDNAIRYTPRGGEIQVKAAPTNGEARVEVRDTGPGIPADQQSRVFGRFYRVDKARSRGLGGAGLGLAIARWAIEANAGRIELESRQGNGCVFRIVLPFAQEHRP